MFKLLIVDDEEWIRIGLTTSIDWGQYGIGTVMSARDGKEALDIIEKDAPDIIVTDIRMPYMDGLEMIEVINKKYPYIKVIIISGYSDFAYAQQAVKLGAAGYVLKPIEEEPLIEICIKCINEIKEGKEKELEEQRIKKQLEESLPLLRERFLNQWVSGLYSDPGEIRQKLEYLGIVFCGLWFRVISFHIDGLESKKSNYSEKEKHSIAVSIFGIISKCLEAVGTSNTFVDGDNNILAIMSFDSIEGYMPDLQFIKLCDDINRRIKEETGHSLTIGLGGCYCGYDKVCESYREARSAIQHMFYLGKDRVITREDIRFFEGDGFIFKAENEVILENAVRMLDSTKVSQVLAEIKEDIISCKTNITSDYVKLVYMQLANTILRVAYEMKPELRSNFLEISKRLKNLEYMETIFEMHSFINDFQEGMFELLSYKREPKIRKIVEMAIQYIDNHLTEEITLNIIAEHLYINPSYLCKIFSEQMGEPLTKYIMRQRIEKAKSLLKDARLKIYEVGEQVGYPNTRYFTRIFKELEGITPVEFREKVN